MAADAKLAALERLARLRADGILTEAEFAAEKAAVLAGRSASPTMPLHAPPPPAAYTPTIVSAPPPPRRSRLRQVLRYGMIAFLISLTLEVIRYLPHGAADAAVARCDSQDARDVLKDALEHGVAERETNVRLLDVANMVERSSDPAKGQRICAADITLNSGDQHIGYRLYRASNGRDLIVETMDDPGPSATAAPGMSPTGSTQESGGATSPARGVDMAQYRNLPKDKQDLIEGIALGQMLAPPEPRLPCVRNLGVPDESAQALTCLNGGRRYTMPASVAGLPTSYRAVDRLPDEQAVEPAGQPQAQP